MPDFDPFASGSATPTAPPAADGFDPFANGLATVADVPIGKDHWANLYSGITGLDQRVDAPQRAAFAQMDKVFHDPKDARARAVNQSFVTANYGFYGPWVEANWDALKVEFAAKEFGTKSGDVNDVWLYDKIAERLGTGAAPESLKPWSLVARGRAESSSLGGRRTRPETGSAEWRKNPLLPDTPGEFWEAINRMPGGLPEAPKDLPDMWISTPGEVPVNPAVAAGVYNGVFKPLVEGVFSPLGVATLGTTGALKTAGTISARRALAGISGTFTGLMAYSTAKATPEAIRVAMNPDATTQQKVEAVGGLVSNAGLTLVGALGTAFELMPDKGIALGKSMEGKPLSEGTLILREQANAATDPLLARRLGEAAEELGKLAEFETPGMAAAASEKPVIATNSDGTFKVIGDKGALTMDGLADAAEAQRVALAMEGGTQPEKVAKVGETLATPKPAEPASTPSVPESTSPVPESKPVAPESKTGPEATEPVPVAEIQRQYSIKAAAIEKDLKAQGLQPPTKGERVTDEMAQQWAAQRMQEDPEAGAKLVRDLAANPRPMSANEVTLARFEYVRLNIERDQLQAEFDAAAKAGQPTEDIATRISDVRQAIADTAAAIRPATGEQGRAFRALQLFTKEDYSLGTMERRRIETRGGEPLTPAQAQTVADLNAKLSAKDAELEAMRAKLAQALEGAETEAPARRPRPAPPGLAERLSKQADAARARMTERLKQGRVSAGIDPADLFDSAIIGADLLAKGVTKFGEWSAAMIKELGEAIRPALKDIFDAAQKHASQEGRVYRLEQEKARIEASIKKLETKLAENDLSGPAKKQNRPREQEIETLLQKRDELAAELSQRREEATRIKELEAAIAEKSEKIKQGDLSTEGQPQNRPATEAIEVLKQERDALNDELAELRKEVEKPERDAGKMSRELESLNRQIAEKKAALATGDIRPESSRRANRPLSPELEQAKQELESLNQRIRETRAGDPALQLESKKARLNASIAELRRRIQEGDFEPQTKKELAALDDEANKLQSERDQLREQFEHLLEQDRYQKASLFQKVKTQALDLYDAARLLMTTGEFSFILRQGKVGVLSHPIKAARTLPDTFRAFLRNPTESNALNLRVLNHPDAAAAISAGLHLVEEGSKLTKQEEFLMSRLAERSQILSQTVGRFNRAATVFMNKLRFDMFNTMRESSGGLNPKEQEALAHFVNVATGRGTLGMLEPAAVPLARLMFSPRYLASRIQLAVGEPLWGGTWATRRIIAKEYARTLIGLGVYYGAMKLAFGDKAEIGDDPRSSDFGKIKIGNTRIDPLAGLSQVIVFAARTATGETVNGRGKERDIRGPKVPFGGEKWSDVAARFARSKLHPVPGAIINLFDGSDLAGNPTDLQSMANPIAWVDPSDSHFAGPMTWVDVYQALEEQDLPEGVAISLLAMLGEGLQTYDANAKRRKSSQAEKPKGAPNDAPAPGRKVSVNLLSPQGKSVSVQMAPDEAMTMLSNRLQSLRALKEALPT